MSGSMVMIASKDQAAGWQSLEQVFGSRFQRNTSLARYTAVRVGGPADVVLEVLSSAELAMAVRTLWSLTSPFVILGGGSNVLVSDAGVRGVVILNHARQLRFDEQFQPPQVWAESGVNFGVLARQAAQRGLAGFEWAAGIPGTIGGAVFGNAGAHGSDMTSNLEVAEILHQTGEIESWPVDKFEFSYRSSLLKRKLPDKVYSPAVVVLSATLRLEHSSPEVVQARIDSFVAHRRRTQPPGASMGSMFKNPPGDYAGRLIESVGLKGMQIGNAEISSLHANFFINRGQATASELNSLIRLAQKRVFEQTGVSLELEIELIGEW